MAYYHGPKASEIDTAIVTPAQSTAGLPVVFGTAPVHLTSNPYECVNKPIICYSYAEAVEQLGYSPDWRNFTLCEVLYSQFMLYAVAPIVFINVLDPKKHKKSATTTVTLTNGKGTVVANVLLDTLKVKDGNTSSITGEVNVDYTAAFDVEGQLVITVTDTGKLKDSRTLSLTYDEVDPTMVKPTDVIGGVDTLGNETGFELINRIYNMFGLVPGLIAAPGWTEEPMVASILKAKSRVINSLYAATILTDIDTKECKKYTDCYEWKNGNSYTGKAQIVLWPCCRNGDYIFHQSTHMLGIIGQVDASNSDIPYESPSNKDMNITGLCLIDGTEVNLTFEQANLLNSQGIVTALNRNGWKSWGDYTGAYPGITDVKDTFICVRRMFDWDDQIFINTYWQKIDKPMMPVLIQQVIDSEKIRLNSLVSRGFLLGADIEFREKENPLTDLLAGIIRFHKKRTPPVPAQVIESISEYDTTNFKALFA